MAGEYKARLDRECLARTGVRPSQVQVILRFLALNNIYAEQLNKATVADLLKRKDLSPEARYILETRATFAKTSTAKFAKLATMADNPESRVRGLLQYGGASRTLRWAGRGVQPQNLTKFSDKTADPVQAADAVLNADLDTIELCYGDPLTLLSGLVRTVFRAPEGKTLAVIDYSAVEVRGAAWVADDQVCLGAFKNKVKMYEMMAGRVYGVEAKDIGKEDPRRQVGKCLVLGCGYGMGPAKFRTQYPELGLSEAQAEAAVKTYRDTFNGIRTMWKALDEAFRTVIKTGKSVVVRNKITVCAGRAGTMPAVHIVLPSGRLLTYPKAEIQGIVVGSASLATGGNVCRVGGRKGRASHTAKGTWLVDFGDSKVELDTLADPQWIREDVITYYGPKSGKKTEEEMEMEDDDYNKDFRVIVTHGAKLFENIVQAVCRDLLAEALLNVRERVPQAPVVLHVHDELVAEVDRTTAKEDYDQVFKAMTTLPKWAAGFPLEAEGKLTDRYCK